MILIFRFVGGDSTAKGVYAYLKLFKLEGSALDSNYGMKPYFFAGASVTTYLSWELVRFAGMHGNSASVQFSSSL
ncbi:hypothetical protein SUGI_0000950 [Cryptomeria japonica]|nr:hypothetical protein SUGI_0000950 [Cryptomeria japonica]